MGNRPERLSFTLDSEPVRFLRARDSRLSRLIDMVGDVTLTTEGPPYAALAGSIVSQQLSGKAAESIWKRLVAASGQVTPQRLAGMDDETLRAAGLSRPKVAYLRDLTRRVLSKDLNLDALPALPDEEVVRALVAVHGIGVWTAQMFLIFCLGRMDVFAPMDLGLRSAMMWLYSMPGLPTEKDSLPIAEAWRPYRTVASLYLWQAVTLKLTRSAGGQSATVEN